MTTFAIATNTNIDACAGGTGGHTYNLSNGAALTIDQDSRAGLNGTSANTIERVTVAATGGSWLLDGRYVRLVPFASGSGSAVAGETVTCGSAADATAAKILSDGVAFPGARIDAAISSAGGSLTTEQAAQLAETHAGVTDYNRSRGLDAANPATITNTSITAGTLSLTLANDPATNTTVITRTS